MMQMRDLPRSFRITSAVVFPLVAMTGLLYGLSLSIPAGPAAALAAAFALEAVLYLLPGFEGARRAVERRFRPPALAAWMVVSGAAPYLVYAVASGAFRWQALAVLLALATVISLWYVGFSRRPAADLGFVAIVAAVLLANPFEWIYLSPVPRVPMGILGQLMWTRLAILAALSIARMEVKGFGFLPSRRDWAAGARNFALFLPVGLLLGWLLEFSSLRLRPGEPWQIALLGAGTFLGMLWVVALREEFFFRGLLQPWLGKWMRSEAAGLLAASAVFGLVHLPFRSFPNWDFALLAAVAGVFYGRAYLQARSVRAAMVAHALVNTVWRVLLS